MKTTVSLLLAAGMGKRTGFSVPKQWKQIGFSYLFEYSLRAFMDVKSIQRHFLVVREEELDRYEDYLLKEGLLTNVVLVVGGDSRQKSVKNGLQKIKEFYAGKELPKFVAIHDAARPLIQCDFIQEVLETAWREGAAIAAAPVFDTVKKVNKSLQIVSTESRRNLFVAQTPQIFQFETIFQAHQEATGTKEYVTDDAMLLEHRKIAITVVPNPHANLKVTTAADFEIGAEYLLRKNLLPPVSSET